MRVHITSVANHNKHGHGQTLNAVKIMDTPHQTTPPPYPGPQYSQQYTSPQYTGQGYPKQQFSNVTPSAAGYPPGATGYPPAPVAPVVYHAPPPMPYGLNNRPDDWLFFNICTCLFCCWPISIFGIWKSMESRQAADRGDRETAVRNANVAKQLGLASFIIGLLIEIIIVVVVVVYASIVFEELAKAARRNGTDAANETTTHYTFDGSL